MADKKHDGKHLSLSDRQFIEDGLNCRLSLKEIALGIFKDPTTVSKEIRRSRIEGRPRKPNKMVHCEKYRNCAVKISVMVIAMDVVQDAELKIAFGFVRNMYQKNVIE